MPDEPPSPNSLTQPEYAVTAERLATLKQRLQAISVKHTPRRASQDSTTLYRTSSTGTMSESQSVNGGNSRPPSVGSMSFDDDDRSVAQDQDSPEGQLKTEETPLEPAASCYCRSVISETDPRQCRACKGILRPIAQLRREKDALLADLQQAQKRLQVLEERQDASTHEMSQLRTRVHDLEDAVASKDKELASVKVDLDRMGQKLIDEVEVRAELQHSKDALQEELEELTKSLFEEANSMVATEARQRYEHEKREKSLGKQLEDMKVQLQMEQAQLQELRSRMEAMEGGSLTVNLEPASQRSSIYSVRSDSASESYADSTGPDEAIDPILFAEFQDFMTSSPDVKLSKMHTLHFMRNVLEDDVSPCLRFGGNPRTSTKKFIEAIIANTCFVEELSASQTAAIEGRKSSERLASKPGSPRLSVSPTRKPAHVKRNSLQETIDFAAAAGYPISQTRTPPPTQAIFNKSVMERLSNAFGGNSYQSAAATFSPNTCSTCGRTGQSSCRFQFKVSASADDIWCPICANCRDRLVAVCEFYMFARHVRQGLYSTRKAEDVYLEMLTMKRKMFYARIGAAKFAEKDAVFTRRKTRPNSVVTRSATTLDNTAGASSPSDAPSQVVSAPPSRPETPTIGTMPQLSFSPLYNRKSDTPNSPLAIEIFQDHHSTQPSLTVSDATPSPTEPESASESTFNGASDDRSDSPAGGASAEDEHSDTAPPALEQSDSETPKDESVA
ncbi:rab guanine nucleotide exchange factor S2 [Gaertneriomyces sp. JEL0708]|nr:rab guanine nucleotide exchange factor S2 [Gaertneriomyces sp. JEL0708]